MVSKLATQTTEELSSDDSVSTDEGMPTYGNNTPIHDSVDECARLQHLFRVSNDDMEQFELDSKMGLNGSLDYWSFPCLLDKPSKRFYVWFGETTIDKFTKTTFLNIVSFA